jgi:hypothetical protein
MTSGFVKFASRILHASTITLQYSTRKWWNYFSQHCQQMKWKTFF